MKYLKNKSRLIKHLELRMNRKSFDKCIKFYKYDEDCPGRIVWSSRSWRLVLKSTKSIKYKTNTKMTNKYRKGINSLRRLRRVFGINHELILKQK